MELAFTSTNPVTKVSQDPWKLEGAVIEKTDRNLNDCSLHNIQGLVLNNLVVLLFKIKMAQNNILGLLRFETHPTPPTMNNQEI